MKRKFVLITSLLICPLAIFSQTNYLPGYIIKNDLDTLFGVIEDFGEARNSKTCHFKGNKTAEVKIFNPEDLWAYRFDDGKFYVSKEIELEGEKHMVFLEYLLSGIYNLYYTNFQGKEMYFLENEEGRMTELSNATRDVYIEGQEYMRNSNKFKGVLKASFVDCPELAPKIDKARLNHKSLIKLTKEYHELTCKDKECIVYEKQNIPIKIRVGPTFGAYYLRLKNPRENEGLTSYLNHNFFIGFLAHIEFPRRNNSFSIEFSGDYSRLYFYELSLSSTLNTDYHYYMSQEKFKIAPRYSFLISKFKLGLFIGIQLDSYSHFSGSKLEESVSGSTVISRYSPYVVEIDRFQFGYFGGFGIEYPIGKRSIYINSDLEVIPVKSVDFVDSRLIGFGLSTGILF